MEGKQERDGRRGVSMGEAGREGRMEKARKCKSQEKVDLKEEPSELSGRQSLDSPVERLGRYLVATLNFEPEEEEEEEGGLLLDGYDDPADLVLDEDFYPPCSTALGHTPSATMNAAVPEVKGQGSTQPDLTIHEDEDLFEEELEDCGPSCGRVQGSGVGVVSERCLEDGLGGADWRPSYIVGEGDQEDDGWVSDSGEMAARCLQGTCM